MPADDPGHRAEDGVGADDSDRHIVVPRPRPPGFVLRHRPEEPQVRDLDSSVAASRRGNRRLKNLLIFSCNSLTRSANRFGEYYRACRGRGMCHGEALKAVARKRLKVIYAVMRDKAPYAA